MYWGGGICDNSMSCRITLTTPTPLFVCNAAGLHKRDKTNLFQPEDFPQSVTEPSNRFGDLLLIDRGERGAEKEFRRLLDGYVVRSRHGSVIVRRGNARRGSARLGAETRALDQQDAARDAFLEYFVFNG